MQHQSRLSRPRSVRRRTDTGANLVEYALLIALIALVCVGAIMTLPGAIQPKLSRAGSGLALSSAG